MNEKQFTLLLNDLKGSLGIEQFAKLLYLMKAWKKLSPNIEERFTFEYFYQHEVNVKNFYLMVNNLSNYINLFELFLNQNIRIEKLKKSDFLNLFDIVNQELIMPNVCDVFYSMLDKYMDFSVANQIADLGVKLLDQECPEIYSPFSNAYNICYYTNKKILAESFADEYIIELMKVLDGVNIDFSFRDPLVSPLYTNSDSSNLLKQFDCILSFPPMGLSTNNEFLYNDIYNRFKFHKVKSTREVAHFEHILAQTSGKAVVLMPVGFTYRGNQDEEFRKYLIESNLLEAVIQLPPNLHNATSIETTFIIINKKKEDDSVFFLNLKHNSFIHKVGRRITLQDLNRILSIYEAKQELENISRLITPEEISNNNFSFAIDRYIISKEVQEAQEKLHDFELINLEEISDIRRSQLFKDEGEGEEVYELSPSDFKKGGFLLESGKVKQIGSQYKRLQTYKLESFDVLLSTKGTIGKVAIIGETNKTMIASQALQVIRLKDNDKKDKAISLYMFLKSDLGQIILLTLQSGVAMPQISTVEIKKLKIPLLNKEQEKQIVFNFYSEIEMYNEINYIEKNIQQLHNNFTGAK